MEVMAGFRSNRCGCLRNPAFVSLTPQGSPTELGRMKIWKRGDESRAICPTCECRTDVVFLERTVEIEEPVPHSVEDVLVAVCRECDGIAVIPYQSTFRLKAALATWPS